MNIGFYAPSYKRPKKSITQTKYPFVNLVVMESEKNEYLKNGNDVITCPDHIQGNIARVRNWIYNSQVEKHDAVVIIDDDCKKVGYWQNQRQYIFEPDELMEFFESMYLITRDWGFYLFGLNCVMDKGAYREHTPFSTTKFVGAPCSMILKGNKCSYDEEIPLKEDYDFTLQNLHKYGGVVRANFAHYDVKQAQQMGGCSQSRNNKEEERQFGLLQGKWGSKIIQRDTKSKRGFDFNPILKSPINGV